MEGSYLVAIVLFTSLAWAMVAITRTISENRLKGKALDHRAPEELVGALLTNRGDPNLHSSLKWGLVVAFVGVALMVLEALPFPEDSPFGFGLVLFAGGAGLLAYYAIARRRRDEPGAPPAARPAAG